MASPTWWTWVWVNSRSWRWTERPGVLGFMGSQRVGHDWATELNWTEYSTVYMYHNFFIHSSVSGDLGCFHVLAIVNSAAMNKCIHVSFSILVSSGYMPRSGTAGSYGGFQHLYSQILYRTHWTICWSLQTSVLWLPAMCLYWWLFLPLGRLGHYLFLSYALFKAWLKYHLFLFTISFFFSTWTP